MAENQPLKKYRMNPTLSAFAARLGDAITAGFDPGRFAPLALELFALQYEANATYRQFCQRQGVSPATAGDWTRIPSLPTAAFKWSEPSCVPVADRTTYFQTSGTTDQQPGRHVHSRESLRIYEVSLWAWFQAVWGRVDELLALTPGPQAAPHSSLVHMFETIRARCGQPGSVFAGIAQPGGPWRVDFDRVMACVRRAEQQGAPLTVLGTAFSFVHWLDYLEQQGCRCHLPPGSRVLETGGYKNASRELPKAELHALITGRLGVAPDHIVSEYGMSELGSQAYAGSTAAAGGGGFRFPPWARARLVSPETGGEVAEGQTGLIRVVDLANVFSVAALQTEDLGVRRDDGFELVGRTRLAEPRGCSLMSA